MPKHGPSIVRNLPGTDHAYPSKLSTLVFDRMFSLGVRGSGVDAPPITARVVGGAGTPGLKRHFLYCSLKPETVATKSAGKSGATAAREKVVRGGLRTRD
jgi:hypothetical protein